LPTHTSTLLLLDTDAANTSYLTCVQAKELLRRKSELIMKLTTAGADLDQVIRDNQHEIDEVLLKMLEKRAEAAYKCVVLPQKLSCWHQPSKQYLLCATHHAVIPAFQRCHLRKPNSSVPHKYQRVKPFGGHRHISQNRFCASQYGGGRGGGS